MKQKRFENEVAILDKILGRANYRLEDPYGLRTELLALVKTERGKFYYLFIKMHGYPEVCPTVYVKGELKDCKGNPMSTTDASMHCYGYEDGNTKLCIGWESSWNPQTTIIFLYLRGKIWLECYESHLVTGKPIDYYLRHA